MPRPLICTVGTSLLTNCDGRWAGWSAHQPQGNVLSPKGQKHLTTQRSVLLCTNVQAKGLQ
jgi:hypothetical protein